MKRIVPSVLLGLCLLLLPIKERSLAQDQKQEPVTPKLESLKWNLLKPNIAKTDLGGNLPEVVILRVSNEEFEKIHASKIAAKKYFDGQHIFRKKLIRVVFCSVWPQPHDPGGDWIVATTHTVYSTACISAVQLSKETK